MHQLLAPACTVCSCVQFCVQESLSAVVSATVRSCCVQVVLAPAWCAHCARVRRRQDSWCTYTRMNVHALTFTHTHTHTHTQDHTTHAASSSANSMSLA